MLEYLFRIKNHFTLDEIYCYYLYTEMMANYSLFLKSINNIKLHIFFKKWSVINVLTFITIIVFTPNFQRVKSRIQNTISRIQDFLFL